MVIRRSETKDLMQGETMASRGGDETMVEDEEHGCVEEGSAAFRAATDRGCRSYWRFAPPAHLRINAHSDSTSDVACQEV
jgi:hypothetical protein